MIEHYTKISITNGDQSLISRDIRSYHDTLIVWDISVESFNKTSKDSLVGCVLYLDIYRLIILNNFFSYKTSKYSSFKNGTTLRV